MSPETIWLACIALGCVATLLAAALGVLTVMDVLAKRKNHR